MSTTTLTDRYVSALTRLLPARQRRDIAQELRASIADAVDERLESGADVREAERDVLAGLGDPTLLAADYTDRPTALIGPRYFGDYRRLLTLLAGTVAPGIAIVVAVAQVLSAVVLWQAILVALAIGLAVAALGAFWLTLLFAVLERLPRPREAWKPSALRTPDDSVGSSLGGIAFLLAIAGILALSPFFTSVVDASGQPISVIAPALWADWAPVVIAILVVAVVFGVVTEYAGWSIPLALVNVVLVLGGTALLFWWATHDLLLNAEFFEAIGWGADAAGAITVVLLVLLTGGAVVDVVGGFVRARRRAVGA